MMLEFKRLRAHERYPRDAVIVTVRQALGRTVAEVAAVEVIADFPVPVPEALRKAEALCIEAGLSHIAVVVDDGAWRPEWGILVD